MRAHARYNMWLQPDDEDVKAKATADAKTAKAVKAKATADAKTAKAVKAKATADAKTAKAVKAKATADAKAKVKADKTKVKADKAEAKLAKRNAKEMYFHFGLRLSSDEADRDKAARGTVNGD
jgi:membrane protein involved in colicin uptake